MEQKPPLLLFDGVCNLCNGFVQFVIKQDKTSKFKFAALQSKTGQDYLQKFSLPKENFTTFVYFKNERYYTKSTAALTLLKDLGGLWKLTYAFMIFPAFFRDFFYNLVAKNRYKIFGKSESCLLPTPELKARFLE